VSNPFLNDKAMQKAADANSASLATADAGWAAPDLSTRATPIDDGPISTWKSGTMTVGGTITATGVLMVILLAAATAGWLSVDELPGGQVRLPMLAIAGIVVGFVCALVVAFKPNLARVLGPIYAVGEGFFLGALSKGYENYQDGIVVQAIGATLGVFVVMLVLYRTRIIKVTDKFRRTVIMATLGLAVFYLVSMVISLFGGSVSFLSSSSLLGIGFSILAAGLAALNLSLDFDFIEKGSKAGLPKSMEWYGAFGLLVTLVWLYLELLRLLSKLNQR
jgi:uncharacterized YccA/Bax inhibitor family protein